MVGDGDGNAARMSEMEPSREAFPAALFCLSFSFSTSNMPTRLAVLPRSKLDASRVARRMSSGRLLALPRPGPGFEPSRFSGGGRFSPFSVTSGVLGDMGDTVPLDTSAPPFSR